MTPTPDQDRIDLVWAPESGSEQPGWTLYLDGAPIANTTSDLPPAAAQQWADALLDNAVAWLSGAWPWYFTARPRDRGGASR